MNIVKKISAALLGTLITFTGVFSYAVITPVTANAETKEEYEAELQQLQKEIDEKQAELSTQKEHSSSIQSQIDILEAKIKKDQLEIEARNETLNELSGSISETQQKINELNEKIAASQESLADLIRKTDQKDNTSLVEVLLGSKNFSDFFTDVQDYSSLKGDLQQELEVVKADHIETKSKEDQLTAQKVQQQGLQQIQMLEKKQIQSNQDQQEVLLQQSKTKENFYEDTIASKKQQAAQIQAALFALQGSNTNINFGQALNLAKEVQSYTGVRPAFLLAILTQETNIGQNVGTCNLPGQTPGRMWNDIMPGPNSGSTRDDQSAYLRIVKSLGISPTAEPLSCPQEVGWGGAMGPAQFIPTTWEGMIPSIARATGSNPPNPWNPRDAFFAAGIYLANLGAGAGTHAAEMEAAGRYFAGANWDTLGVGYANSVESLAEGIQQDKIDPIESANQ